MIKGEYEYLANLAKINVCAEHGTPLEVAWHDKESSNVLLCGQGHYPDAISRQPSLTESYKQGEELPEHIEDKIKKRERRKATMSVRPDQDLILGTVPRTDLATGELLGPEMIQALMHYATKYALDIYRGHVVLMYGKPYITIDGYLYHANRTGTDYQLRSRPLADDERKTYIIPEGAHAWVAEVIVDQGKRSFTGLGIVTLEEMEARSPRDATRLRSPVVAAHPWQLAQKRAEWQAMRRAFPIGESEEKTEVIHETSGA